MGAESRQATGYRYAAPRDVPRVRVAKDIITGRRITRHSGITRVEGIVHRAPGAMRTYTPSATVVCPTPAWLVTIGFWWSTGRLAFTIEDRRHRLVGKDVRVTAMDCEDAGALLAAVADTACRLALAPPRHLHIVTDDRVDAGVARRAAFLLLAAVYRADVQDVRDAA